MGSTGDLKQGAVIKYNGENCIVVNHQHVTSSGRGAAYHQVKLRNLRTGKLMENRYRSDESVEFVNISRTDFQYLYRDGEIFYFMNKSTYDQIPVEITLIGEQVRFLKENQEVQIAFEGENVISVDMPLNVVLKVNHTEPGLKGDTATNVLKPAVLETGTTVQVPLFVNIDDMIKVDTKTGDYLERVKE
jgi:elongation factor P